MPWLVLIALVVVGLFLILRAAARSYRRGVRQRFVAYLREAHPAMEAVEEPRCDALRLRTPSGQDGVMHLTTLFSMLSTERPATLEQEREVFARFMAAVTEHDEEASQPLSLDTCADRIMPRLVPKGFFASVPPDADLPHTPVHSLQLEITYVLDGEHSVRYLTGKDLQDLGLTVEALHERAMANLARHFPEQVVRRVAGGNAPAMLKVGDSFDATRLILVPEHLQPGEEIVAVVPDRDTLALLPIPPGNDWTPILKLARTPAGDRLILDRPVRVTQQGFQLV